MYLLFSLPTVGWILMPVVAKRITNAPWMHPWAGPHTWLYSHGIHRAYACPSSAAPRETACLESNRVLPHADELRLVTFPAGWRCQLGEIKLCWSWGQGSCSPFDATVRLTQGELPSPGSTPGYSPARATPSPWPCCPRAGVGLLRAIV